MSDIQCTHLDYRYNNQSIFSDFSIYFREHSTNAIVGPSGCGKTTLLRLIAGLEIPDRGEILIGGNSVSKEKCIVVEPHQRNIGFIFQDLALWPHMSVYDNIAFGMKEHQLTNIPQTIDTYLQHFSIESTRNKYPHQLSGGQKQMIAIIRTLVLNPKILLMDEPMANIDVQIKMEIFNHLQKLQKEIGFTLIYVTHDHREAFYLADRIIVMRQGKVIIEGEKEVVLSSKDPFVQSFIQLQ